MPKPHARKFAPLPKYRKPRPLQRSSVPPLQKVGDEYSLQAGDQAAGSDLVTEAGVYDPNHGESTN